MRCDKHIVHWTIQLYSYTADVYIHRPTRGPTNSHDMTLFETFYRYEFGLHLGFGYLLELFLGFWLGLGLNIVTS